MRGLFASEARCVNNMIKKRWGKTNDRAPTIVSAYVADPDKTKRKPWFNCDFCIDFIERRDADWCDCEITANSILPSTLGAELFLAIDPSEIKPMRLELIGGQAFSIKHYVTYIQHVEEAIQHSLASQAGRPSPYPWREWLRLVPVKKSAFARVLIIGEDITFLYFPADMKPAMQGQCVNLVQQDGCEINVYVDNGQLVCFDGWIRTKVEPSEMKLVATWE